MVIVEEEGAEEAAAALVDVVQGEVGVAQEDLGDLVASNADLIMKIKQQTMILS